MNRACDELFARPAFAGNENRKLIALQALNMFDDFHHRRACAEKSRKKRFERLLVRDLGRRRRALTGGAQIESLRGDCGDHAEPESLRLGDWSRGENGDKSRAIDVAPRLRSEERRVGK